MDFRGRLDNAERAKKRDQDEIACDREGFARERAVSLPPRIPL